MAEHAVQFEAVDFDPFASSDGSNILPLSATQRELHAAVQMGPQAHCAFNLVYVLQLRGPLAIDSLRAALATVVQRHAALRTVLAADGASQQVLGSVPVDIPQHELAGLSPPDCEAALAEVVEYETHTPFDLARAPLWRARVLSHPDGLHWLVFNVHHWVCDGWSSTVLFGDWAAAYGADRLGLAAPLPTALPYDELVLALESPMVRAQSQEDEAYWRAQHTPPAEPLNLPLERSRPPLKTYACGVETLALDAGTTAAVRSLGARQGCTFFVTMLAVCQGLLARLSGQSDIVLGVPMAYQTQLDNGHAVAHGAHTVPLRVAVDLRAPFSDQLRCTRRTFLDAQAQPASLTFGNLVHSLGLPRGPVSHAAWWTSSSPSDRNGAPFHSPG